MCISAISILIYACPYVHMAVIITCNVYPGSQLKATTSLTMYLSPALMPLAGIIGSGQVVRPTALTQGWGGGGGENRHTINHVFGIIYVIIKFSV